MFHLYVNCYNFTDSCEDDGGYQITYFESLDYLQTVAFTIGYGHITPVCSAAKVRKQFRNEIGKIFQGRLKFILFK